MRQVPLTLPVYVLEESDTEHYSEAARVRGELGQLRHAISDQLPENFAADIGQADKGRRGTVTLVRVLGPGTRSIILETGDGVLIHESLGTFHVPAAWIAEAEQNGAANDPNFTSALEDQLVDAEKLLLAADGENETLKSTVAMLQARIDELEADDAAASWSTDDADEEPEVDEPDGDG